MSGRSSNPSEPGQINHDDDVVLQTCIPTDESDLRPSLCIRPSVTRESNDDGKVAGDDLSASAAAGSARNRAKNQAFLSRSAPERRMH